MNLISVTILTKNSAETLAATLESLRKFPEVLILDTGSTDRTIALAQTFPNVRLISESFDGFGKTHNLASELASYDWILSIDSDEVLSSELAEEILAFPLDSKCVYILDRHNYFQGKRMKGCSGWYPDPVVRLYHRMYTRFQENAVHEKVISDGLEQVLLNGRLIHTPYRSIDDFLQKMQLYSTLFALENTKKPSTLGKAIFRGIAAFFKSYVLKRGFLCGKEGLIISLYNSHSTYYKYLKLTYSHKNYKDIPK